MTTKDQLGSGETRLETAISYMLIAGVIASLILEVAGGAFLYKAYGNLAISQDPSFFIQGRDFFAFVYQQFASKHVEGPGLLLMTMGIIVLILTPYLRVVASIIYFGIEKNVKYVFITLWVLVIVTLSLALH